MDASLQIPTATSVRAVPAKLMFDNRIVINNHLARGRGGKVSFTHLIGYAMVKALVTHPAMNSSYTTVEGKPTLVTPEHVNLGIAIDLTKPDGSRNLVVPSIKAADTMDFKQFWQSYEDIVRRARRGELTMDDYTGTTISLTNPGGIGTVHSMPRLMPGQGTIIGVGAMEHPAAFAGMSDDQLAELAISKIITLTSTYDHRVIQGAQSGEFLKAMHELLLGEHGFYDEIFTALRIPYEPIRWTRDVAHTSEGQIDKAARVVELIHAYRVRGHLMADTDPLEFHIRKHPDLDVREHELTLWDLDRSFPVGGFAGKQRMRLRDILGVLRDSYCRRIGVEYMHIQDPEERRWIQERIERRYTKPTPEEQRHILMRLNAAEAFETFLHTKYVGQKRFSLEGGESVIPLLDEVLTASAEGGLDEVVIGMAHRGRLNVLANIVGKPYEKIFSEFEGHLDPKSTQGSGDVKYHLGMVGKYTTRDGEHATTVSVVANPSHLEAVDPVLEGIVRAKQDRIDLKLEGYTVLPLLVHGDAAFAGQGVVAETLNLSQLRGYRTGGTVHVVINNQVGFTTAPEYSRSSLYSTDVARMIQAPIFHVNGDDPEAVLRVARLAFEYRQAFNKDVVIDLLCYRRRGHNEGDDPSMTNPKMYQIIDGKRSVRKIYTEELIGRGDITVEQAEELLRDYQAQLEQVFKATRDAASAAPPRAVRSRPAEPEPEVETAVDAGVLTQIGRGPHPAARGLHPAQADLATARAPGQDGPRGRHRLGVRRDPGLRLAGLRRTHGPALRSGLAPGHVRPAARVHRGRCHRRRLPAGQAAGGGQRRSVLRARLAAVRVRRDGLRVRLLGGEPGRAGRLGGAVRRLRQRGTVHRGRVHLLRRGQVGPALVGDPAAAALARGPGPRPHLRPDRTVPAAVRRGQHAGRAADHAGELLPPAAASGALAQEEAAGGLHAQVAAAPPHGGLERSATCPPGTFQPVLADPGALGSGPGQARAVLLGQGVLRPAGRPHRAGDHRHGDRAAGAALPAAGGGDQGTAGPVRARPRTSSGCRRSRPTRAPGRSSRSTCSSISTAYRCGASPGRPRPPRRWARPGCTTPSRPPSSRPPSPAAPDRVATLRHLRGPPGADHDSGS